MTTLIVALALITFGLICALICLAMFVSIDRDDTDIPHL